MSVISKTKGKQIVKKIKDPIHFINHALGKKVWSKQKEICLSIKNHKKTTVKACHGVGKSFIAGNIILWFLFSHKNAIVLSTAPTWRQVEKLVWKEIRNSYTNALIPLGGELAPKSPELQIVQDQWYAAGISTNDPDKFQGFHEENVLVVVDEAAGVDRKIFEGIEGIISTMGAKLLLIGNPTNVDGEFYESFKDESYNKITISAFDSPNFKQCKITLDDIKNGEWEDKFNNTIEEKGNLIAPKMISPDWVYDKYCKWGESSPLFQSKVLGIFPEQATDSLIPIHWIDLAVERWYEHNKNFKLSKYKSMGVDVAEFGTDEAVVALQNSYYVFELKTYQNIGVMEYAKMIMMEAEIFKPNAINIDTIGIGTGVEGRIREDGKWKTNRVNVAESPGGNDAEERDVFLNKRSQLFWYLRELFNPNLSENPYPICIPPDDLLISDLSNIKYKINSKAKIQIEAKADFKKRMGRSPDRGDALMLAFAPQAFLDDINEMIANIR